MAIEIPLDTDFGLRQTTHDIPFRALPAEIQDVLRHALLQAGQVHDEDLLMVSGDLGRIYVIGMPSGFLCTLTSASEPVEHDSLDTGTAPIQWR